MPERVTSPQGLQVGERGFERGLRALLHIGFPFAGMHALRPVGVYRLSKAQVHPLGSGNYGGTQSARQRYAHSGDAVYPFADGPGHPLPTAAALNKAEIHVVTADQCDRNDPIIVSDGKARESAATFPAQLVLLALELQHVPATTREDEQRRVLAHQFGSGVLITDNGPGRLQHISGQTSHVAQ